MVHHSGVVVCVKHRHASHYEKCPVCGGFDFYVSHKWRPPKKTNDRAWKLIERGEYLWDRTAVARKSTRVKEQMDAYWENLRRRNPKVRRSIWRF